MGNSRKGVRCCSVLSGLCQEGTEVQGRIWRFGWDYQRSTVHGFSQWPGLPWRDASPLRPLTAGRLAAPPPPSCCILRPIAISALRSRSLDIGCAQPRVGCGWNAEPVAFPQDTGLMGEPSACTSHSPAKLSLKQARAKVLTP